MKVIQTTMIGRTGMASLQTTQTAGTYSKKQNYAGIGKKGIIVQTFK